MTQQYLPDALKGVQYYQYGENKTEQDVYKRQGYPFPRRTVL